MFYALMCIYTVRLDLSSLIELLVLANCMSWVLHDIFFVMPAFSRVVCVLHEVESVTK